MKKLKTKRLGLHVLGSIIVLTSIKAQNQTGKYYAGIASLYCFNNGKIERMTGKKRSTLSPKVIRAWKLGNLSFTYAKYCGIAQLNPQAIGDARFHDLAELNSEIKKTIQDNTSLAENGDRPASLKSEFGVLLNENLAAQEFASLADRMKYASRCEKQFVSQKGFGPLGKIVKETLSENSAKHLINYDRSFGGACPGYREMNGEQRKNLWVFVMMSMAHFESSCQNQVINQGPYGTASGLLQLHEESENLYVSWDPDLNCDKGASRSPRKSLQCGLTMIGNQFYKGAPFFDDSSHWQVLRNVNKPGTQAHQIRYALSQIPDCKASPFFLDVDLSSRTNRKMEVQNRKSYHSMDIAMLR